MVTVVVSAVESAGAVDTGTVVVAAVESAGAVEAVAAVESVVVLWTGHNIIGRQGT